MTDKHVTLVTRNTKQALIELTLYVGVLYLMAHPDQAEKLGIQLGNQWNKVTHRLSVWQARNAIRSLPETDSQ